MTGTLLRQEAALLLNACKAPASAWEELGRSGDPQAFFLAGEEEWRKAGLRPSSRARLTELLAEDNWAGRETERIDRFGARFLPIDDVEYPVRLKDLASPPLGIYVKGDLRAARPAVAVVGTRRCSRYGRGVAELLGRAVAKAGHQVISGGAKGIDAAAHRGCLAEDGETVAVMGTAVDRVYPAENRQLFHEIAERGALISEYPMGTGGDPWRFPERNRLIVGLCNRLVVVESPQDGGSMISSRLALDLGREIWCVPGQITESISRGTNMLIRDGANPLTDIEEFTGKISGRYGQLLLDFNNCPPLETPMTDDEKNVLRILRIRGGRTLDDIMKESGLGFVEAQTCLATLCASGAVFSPGPGRYSAGS